MKKKIFTGIILLLCFLTGFYFLKDIISFQELNHQKELIRLYYIDHQLVTIIAFMVIFIVYTTLAIPGAPVLAIFGGFLFGRWTGTLYVIVASTTGSTFAFLLSRYLLRYWIETRFKKQTDKINQQFEKDGTNYLFILRLIPAFPFFLINIAMGMTKMKTWKFILVSFIGMLPGTFLFLNAGAEIANIEEIKDIFSPQMIISLAILGIFPLVIKKIFLRFKKN